MTDHPKRKGAKKGPSRGARKGTSGGSPTKLTKWASTTICEAIRLGNFKYVAAHMVGIGESTLKTWIQKGEGTWTDSRSGKQPAAKEPYKRFALDFRDAECEAEARAVALLEEAAAGMLEVEKEEWYETNKEGERRLVRDKTIERRKKDWHAAAFLLERRSAERWGRRRHMEIQTQVGDLKQVVVVYEGSAPHPEGELDVDEHE